MSEWQPIKTVPKNGTRVLICCDTAPNAQRVYFACYIAGDRGAVLGTRYPLQVDTYDNFGAPTHWMPLPEPPKEDA